MAGTTTHFGFQLLAPSQEQPEVPLNLDLNEIDAAIFAASGITVGEVLFNSPHDSPAFEFSPITALLFRGATVERDLGGIAIVSIPSFPVDSDSGGSSSFVKAATFTNGTAALVAPTNDVAIFIEKACTIQEVTLLSQGGTGSAVVDIWRSTYAAYPPTVANSLCASALPTISAGIKYQDTTLTGWTKTLAAGDILLVHLASTSTLTNLVVALKLG